MELKIEIIMTEQGMQVNAPQDLVVAFGMLEMAKHTLLKFKEQNAQRVQVAPASILNVMPKGKTH